MQFTISLEGWITVCLQILMFSSTLLTLIRQDKLIKKGQDQQMIKDLTEALTNKDLMLHEKTDEIETIRYKYQSLASEYNRIKDKTD